MKKILLVSVLALAAAIVFANGSKDSSRRYCQLLWMKRFQIKQPFQPEYHLQMVCYQRRAAEG
jgi:dsRNA-specific ribonuclease